MGGEEVEQESERPPRFRWLDAARYAAAFMVTVLIAVVVLKAIKVVFPDVLYVSVVQGSIFVTPKTVGTPDHLVLPELKLDLSLRIDNPRRRAIMYYVNVTAYLFDNDTPASTSRPEEDSLVFFRQLDEAVSQQAEVDYEIHLVATQLSFDTGFFDSLYNNTNGGGASMSGVTMRLEATLVITDTSTNSNSSLEVTYYCWPLVIQTTSFVADAEDLGDDDVFCREAHRDHFI
ncbi:hypothetical protein HU200_056438 [Digitaria exilis]|uniref:Late embryogenesis abundant protein LEA-2 subgroup domain-containing protein n=1 Tax=Digitaria exilis TaxID=1010633 RepID=A0A835AH97_9POAL|nr:hypothetical protein HU200_056438 [Digitaria exilis]CAB3466795.1 unnamed protein product [Digitaria exilis]